MFLDYNYFYWGSLLDIIVLFVNGFKTFCRYFYGTYPSDDVLYLVTSLLYFFSLFTITFFFIRFLVSIFKFLWRIL